MSDSNINISPNRQERQIAQEGFQKLTEIIDEINHPENIPEISIQETGDPIKIPLNVLKLLAEVLKNIKDGNSISIISKGTVFTTQKAAEFLNCSRPYITKLIDEGKLKATKVGRHRRIQFNDLVEFKKNKLNEQKDALAKLMHDSEDLGLYEID
ncbi:helix-turn-helix domain-containing protein [Reichenbachiella versicolor]|uniref:helix-turn-helix domain-containing protein n=1 Tax=Reichenbachiella versicolor TaxID=1821036 RepID=UPI000D6E8627|nr:helix-turn-helix domain-containing protein [Reichenbachiella versicolor]